MEPLSKRGIESLAYMYFYLFIVCLFIYFFISEFHSHFSKRSEVDLYVTG